MSGQFDIPPEELKLVEEKVKRKAFLRNEYLKQKTNPFQHATGEGGAVFDAALQRYSSMKVSGYDYFKPQGKNIIYGFALMVFPMAAYTWYVKHRRDTREASLRRGEVAYKDRRFRV